MKTLSKYIQSVAVGILLAVPAQAQDENGAFYVYRNDGDFNGFFYDQVLEIRYSKFDQDMVEQEEHVMQEIVTSDSVYRIPLAAIVAT